MKEQKIRCNSEYKRLCQPITKQEYARLEKELKEYRGTVRIKTWINTVLCDYEKLDICQKYNIPYENSRMSFRNSEESLLWLCKKQLKRTDLTIEMRRYLIGKRYLYERIIDAHALAEQHTVNSSKRANKTQHEYLMMKTYERLAKEYNISSSTICKYAVYSEALDTIYNVSVQFASDIMLSIIKISQENVVEIAKLPEKEIKNISEQLLTEKISHVAFSNIRKLLTNQRPSPKAETSSIRSISIKDMPEYDPDAEVASLTLTIPSWISSMNRVRDVSDMSKVSIAAKAKLLNELEKLGNATLKMLEILKEKE